MYESYSIQSLPERKLRELLGSSLCAFNSNNTFIIENILNVDSSDCSWHELMNKVSGNLSRRVDETITIESNSDIATEFKNIIEKRNRIIHSFLTTNPNGEIALWTIDKNNIQTEITEQYL